MCGYELVACREKPTDLCMRNVFTEVQLNWAPVGESVNIYRNKKTG